MSVVRGRPPGLAGGIRGASTAYCSSLSACPAPKSPTKARLSAVHMACLQEGLLPSLNRRHELSVSSSSQPRGLLKRPLRRERPLANRQTAASWRLRHPQRVSRVQSVIQAVVLPADRVAPPRFRQPTGAILPRLRETGLRQRGWQRPHLFEQSSKPDRLQP